MGYQACQFLSKPGVLPYHGNIFPTPCVHKAALHRELERPVKLNVLKLPLDSEWAVPRYIIHKKKGTIRCTFQFLGT